MERKPSSRAFGDAFQHAITMPGSEEKTGDAAISSPETSLSSVVWVIGWLVVGWIIMRFSYGEEIQYHGEFWRLTHAAGWPLVLVRDVFVFVGYLVSSLIAGISAIFQGIISFISGILALVGIIIALRIAAFMFPPIRYY